MEKSSFFNSVNGDRKYKSEDFAAFFNSLITNGVFPNPSTNLQVMANNNMTLTIKAGKAWINGYVYINTDDLVFTLDVADGVLKRIDRVVIQYSAINREIKTKIKKGAFASSPVAPTLQRDSDVWELGIADILISNGVTSITQANITDLRLNNSHCGIVNSLIQADTTTLLNQYTEGFNTWFTGIKNTLGSDVAGNLLNQIGTLGNLTTTAKDNLVNAINELKSSLGDLATLNTTDKTSLVKAINELFTNANNGKVSVADAITAKGVSASPTDTFSTLATKIGQIYTGKKWASGTLTTSSTTTGLESYYNSGTMISSYYIAKVTGLTFTPSHILIFYPSQNEQVIYKYNTDFSNQGNIQNVTLSYSSGRINGGVGSNPVANTSYYVRNGEFALPMYTSSIVCQWIAYE